MAVTHSHTNVHNLDMALECFICAKLLAAGLALEVLLLEVDRVVVDSQVGLP